MTIAQTTSSCPSAPQVAVEAETFSSAPGLRRRVLSELLAHLLDTFAGAVPEQLAGAPMTYQSHSPHIVDPTSLLPVRGRALARLLVVAAGAVPQQLAGAPMNHQPHLPCTINFTCLLHLPLQ